MIYKVLILIGCFIVGYLCGSIPFGVIISKVFYKKDPRLYGSKNTGGTNVGRVAGKKAGIIVIILDALKMAIPLILGYVLFVHVPVIRDFMSDGDQTRNVVGYGNTLNDLAYYLMALGAFLGHPFSIFLGFKGGKMVACFVGYTCSIYWTAVPLFAPVFFITKKITKITAISSIYMTGAAMLYAWIVYILFATVGPEFANYFAMFGVGPRICLYSPIVSTVAFILLVLRHKDNLKRMANGTENKSTDKLEIKEEQSN